MNVQLNCIRLNIVELNSNTIRRKKVQSNGDIPNGYELLLTYDNEIYEANDGDYYVKF